MFFYGICIAKKLIFLWKISNKKKKTISTGYMSSSNSTNHQLQLTNFFNQVNENKSHKPIRLISTDQIIFMASPPLIKWSEFLTGQRFLPVPSEKEYMDFQLNHPAKSIDMILQLIQLYETLPYPPIPVLEFTLDYYIQPEYMHILTPLSFEELCDCVHLSHFLGILVLTELLCATIASALYDKNPNEMEQMFNVIEPDMSQNQIHDLVNEITTNHDPDPLLDEDELVEQLL